MTQEERRKIYGIMKCPFVVDEEPVGTSGMVLTTGDNGRISWTTTPMVQETDLDDIWGVTDTTPWDDIMRT